MGDADRGGEEPGARADQGRAGALLRDAEPGGPADREQRDASAERSLYESRFDFFTRRVPEIQALKQFCGQAVSQTIFKLHQQATRGREPIAGLAVDLHESWVHVTNGDGGYHEVHTHANCSWCGIYYLEPGDFTMDPPDGVNRFFSPIEILYEDFGTMAYPQKPVTWPPEEGEAGAVPVVRAAPGRPLPRQTRPHHRVVQLPDDLCPPAQRRPGQPGSSRKTHPSFLNPDS